MAYALEIALAVARKDSSAVQMKNEQEGYRKLTRLEESAFKWLRTDCPQCEEDKHWINIEPEEILRIDGKLYIKDDGDILRLVQE